MIQPKEQHHSNVLEHLNAAGATTLLKSLGIVLTGIKPGYVEGIMPVDARTHQPYGILHGGASAALAETLGSIGSHLLVADQQKMAVGIELNINHIRSKKSGTVTGKATILHQGRSSHVWNIEIADEDEKLIATSRLTVMIIAKERE